MRRFLNYLCFFVFTVCCNSFLFGGQYPEYVEGLPQQITGEAISSVPASSAPPAPDPIPFGVPLPAPVSSAPQTSGVSGMMPAADTTQVSGFPGAESVPVTIPGQVPVSGVPGYTDPTQTPGYTGVQQQIPGQVPVSGVPGYTDPTQIPGYTGVQQQIPGQVPVSGVPGYADPTQTPGYTGVQQQFPGQMPASGVPGYTDLTQTPGYTGVQQQIPGQVPASGAYASPSVVPTMPIAPQATVSVDTLKPDEPTAKAAVPSELKGIDTLDVDEAGGNWLIKRMWWEKAEKKIDKIEEEVDGIMDSRSAFYEKRDKTDTEVLDSFYIDVGIDQGKMQEIIEFLLQELKEKREKDASLSVQERAFVKKLEEQKKVLDQLKANIDGVRKVDSAIDEAITKLIEQINKARKYKKEARSVLKEIGSVLDHNKARELYFKIEGASQSIKAIKAYISGEFESHFDETISVAKKQISQIKKDLDSLEQKGISFKQQLKKIEAESEQEKKEKELLDREEELTAELETMKEQEHGWLGTIISYIMMPIKAVWSWISSLWSSTDLEVEQEEIVEGPVQDPVPVAVVQEVEEASKEVSETPESVSVSQEDSFVSTATSEKPEDSDSAEFPVSTTVPVPAQ